MRYITMLMAALAALFFISCAAAPTTNTMPPPDEEEPWAEEIREAKRAANKEAEYFVIRVKEQGAVKALDERTPITGYELQWRQKKIAWLKKARKKGFNGSDEEVEPKWVEKWKQPGRRR